MTRQKDAPNTGSVAFFVPCYNEEGNIGRTIETIICVMKNFSYPYEVIVVDDHSHDGTLAEAEACRQTWPDVSLEIIRNPTNRGLGRNYFIAAQRARAEYFMLVNGDNAEPPQTMRTILANLGKADAVIPYFGLNDTRTASRRIISRFFTFLVNFIGGHRLRYYNGPVLHRTENVRMWFAETAGFGYQAELLCRLLDEGISYLEVQVINSGRERGFSKAFTFKNLLSVANTLFHIFLRRMERIAFNILGPSPK
ncbi:MAG: glycosyltransferase family 2 protein [Elusimicrobia bacterium]|nr:glycosyltransferase family 2 protein [Elusimicrobiota bacterium]